MVFFSIIRFTKQKVVTFVEFFYAIFYIWINEKKKKKSSFVYSEKLRNRKNVVGSVKYCAKIYSALRNCIGQHCRILQSKLKRKTHCVLSSQHSSPPHFQSSSSCSFILLSQGGLAPSRSLGNVQTGVREWKGKYEKSKRYKNTRRNKKEGKEYKKKVEIKWDEKSKKTLG